MRYLRRIALEVSGISCSSRLLMTATAALRRWAAWRDSSRPRRLQLVRGLPPSPASRAPLCLGTRQGSLLVAVEDPAGSADSGFRSAWTCRKDRFHCACGTAEPSTAPKRSSPTSGSNNLDRDGMLYEDARYLAKWDQTIALLWFDEEEPPPPREERPKREERIVGSPSSTASSPGLVRNAGGDLPLPDPLRPFEAPLRGAPQEGREGASA